MKMYCSWLMKLFKGISQERYFKKLTKCQITKLDSILRHCALVTSYCMTSYTWPCVSCIFVTCPQCTLVFNWISLFLKGTRTTRPCLSGRVVAKLDIREKGRVRENRSNDRSIGWAVDQMASISLPRLSSLPLSSLSTSSNSMSSSISPPCNPVLWIRIQRIRDFSSTRIQGYIFFI